MPLAFVPLRRARSLDQDGNKGLCVHAAAFFFMASLRGFGCFFDCRSDLRAALRRKDVVGAAVSILKTGIYRSVVRVTRTLGLQRARCV